MSQTATTCSLETSKVHNLIAKFHLSHDFLCYEALRLNSPLLRIILAHNTRSSRPRQRGAHLAKNIIGARPRLCLGRIIEKADMYIRAKLKKTRKRRNLVAWVRGVYECSLDNGELSGRYFRMAIFHSVMCKVVFPDTAVEFFELSFFGGSVHSSRWKKFGKWSHQRWNASVRVDFEIKVRTVF